jgi:hypothetical protein
MKITQNIVVRKKQNKKEMYKKSNLPWILRMLSLGGRGCDWWVACLTRGGVAGAERFELSWAEESKRLNDSYPSCDAILWFAEKLEIVAFAIVFAKRFMWFKNELRSVWVSITKCMQDRIRSKLPYDLIDYFVYRTHSHHERERVEKTPAMCMRKCVNNQRPPRKQRKNIYPDKKRIPIPKRHT